jgi:hypothetical protein
MSDWLSEITEFAGGSFGSQVGESVLLRWHGFLLQGRLSGCMSKLSHDFFFFRKYQERYFVLDREAKTLRYYVRPEGEQRGEYSFSEESDEFGVTSMGLTQVEPYAEGEWRDDSDVVSASLLY